MLSSELESDSVVEVITLVSCAKCIAVKGILFICEKKSTQILQTDRQSDYNNPLARLCG